jgi:hypothetical protein
MLLFPLAKPRLYLQTAVPGVRHISTDLQQQLYGEAKEWRSEVALKICKYTLSNFTFLAKWSVLPSALS